MSCFYVEGSPLRLPRRGRDASHQALPCRNLRKESPPLWGGWEGLVGGVGGGFIFFCCFLVSFSSYSQKIKKYIAAADELYTAGDYYGASLNYKQALESDSTIIDLAYKYAETCRLTLDFRNAEYWYNKVYEQDKEGKYSESAFWLAMTKKSNGKYKEAKILFEKFYKKYKKKNTYYSRKSLQEIGACDYAQFLISHKDSLTIIHLDSSINTVNAEFSAYETNDSMLYFSSLRETPSEQGGAEHYSKLYKVNLADSAQQQIEELDTLFNNPGYHNANVAFSTNQQRVYFTRCKNISPKEIRCELFVREFKNGKWQKAYKLNDTINLPGYTTTQPGIGFNDSIGEILFFVSDRPGGQGKLDIWASTISKDGDYGKPYNLGKSINSIDNEVTPFYCSPCKILFFSSDWHKGLGGFDIFRSHQTGSNFSEPENMGFPINSSYNDLYFTMNNKSERAFFSSNRVGSFFSENENCCNDIYSFTIPKSNQQDILPPKIDSTQMLITEMKLLVPLALYFHNDEPDSKTLDTTTFKNYKQTFDDYLALREKYKTEFSKGLHREAKKQAASDIDNFFEDSVIADMQDLEKFAQLLVEVLKKGEYVQITLKGYCSPLASTQYNVNLAKRRISSLRNYLNEYENGILSSYINNTNHGEGKLEIMNEDIGELKASANVSDNPNDIKNSIYSRLAALERKIQIIAVSTGNKE